MAEGEKRCKELQDDISRRRILHLAASPDEKNPKENASDATLMGVSNIDEVRSPVVA
jgi:hypothetical protein